MRIDFQRTEVTYSRQRVVFLDSNGRKIQPLRVKKEYDSKCYIMPETGTVDEIHFQAVVSTEINLRVS